MPSEFLLGLALGSEQSGQGWGFPQNLVGSAYQEQRLRESSFNFRAKGVLNTVKLIC